MAALLLAGPLPAAPPGRTDAIPEGQALYAEHCAACHGDAADGHGVLAGGLSVPPADLAALARTHDAAWFYQRISAGWAQMHPQAHNLSKVQRRRIARYLNSLSK